MKFCQRCQRTGKFLDIVTLLWRGTGTVRTSFPSSSAGAGNMGTAPAGMPVVSMHALLALVVLLV
jgi:hypothetical protein